MAANLKLNKCTKLLIYIFRNSCTVRNVLSPVCDEEIL